MSEKQIEQHESYGIIGINRVHGGPRELFGAGTNVTGSSFVIRLYRGERRIEADGDRFYATDRKLLAEVELSPAQFAELFTTLNVDDGVPCTIRWIGGKRMADPPKVHTEMEKIAIGFSVRLAKLVSTTAHAATLARGLLDGSGVLKKPERVQIANLVSSIEQELTANLPFIQEMFQEAVERTINKAKADIDAFLAHALHMAGVKALKSSDGILDVKQLTDGEGE